MKELFISWSGATAEAYAENLLSVLRKAFPTQDRRDSFFFSKTMDDGMRWLDEIFKAIRNAKFGILILTKESFERPWVNFEAGGIFTNKTEDDIKRIIPIYVDMNLRLLEKSPLRFFQSNLSYTGEDIVRLIETIGKTLKWTIDNEFYKDNAGKILITKFLDSVPKKHPIWNWLYSNEIKVTQPYGCVAEMESSDFLKLRKKLILNARKDIRQNAKSKEKKGRIIFAGQSLSEAFGSAADGEDYICNELKHVINQERVKYIDIIISDPFMFNDVTGSAISANPMMHSIPQTLNTLNREIFPICIRKKCHIAVYFVPLLEIDHAVITDEFMAFRSTKLWTRNGEYKGSFKLFARNPDERVLSEYNAHKDYLDFLIQISTKIDLEIDSQITEADNEIIRQQKQFRQSVFEKYFKSGLTNWQNAYIYLNKVYNSQLVDSVADSWMGGENIHTSFVPSQDIKSIDDLYNPQNLLDDSTQKCLLPYIKQTKDLFDNVIKKYDSSIITDTSGDDVSRSGVMVFPSLDLGIPNNVQRIAGGFATGMFIMWKCGTPLIPVDATVNVCSSSVFPLEDFDESITDEDFIKKIDDIKNNGSSEGYSFSFDGGNHFLMIAKDESDHYYLVMHSSAKEYKDSYLGLYPTEDNWYYSKIRTYPDRVQKDRYFRYLKDADAKDFISFAHKLEGYNVEIHRWFAEQWISECKPEGQTFHHYYMPNDSSIAIGTYVEKPGTVVPIFSNVGKPIYLFEIGRQNWKVKIDGKEKCVIPHGWGQELISTTDDNKISVDVEDNTLSINGNTIKISSEARLSSSQKKIRDFADGAEFLKKGKKFIDGKIVKTLSPVFLYCSSMKGKV